MKKDKKPFNVKLFYRRTCLIIYDIISVVFASYMAVLIRYEFHLDTIPDHFLEPINRFLPVNIVLTLFVFYLFRLYHSLWAFAGENELQNLVVSCVISAALNSVGLQFFKTTEQPVPKSYYFLYMFVLISRCV